jgi:hypothetical protein
MKFRGINIIYSSRGLWWLSTSQISCQYVANPCKCLFSEVEYHKKLLISNIFGHMWKNLVGFLRFRFGHIFGHMNERNIFVKKKRKNRYGSNSVLTISEYVRTYLLFIYYRPIFSNLPLPLIYEMTHHMYNGLYMIYRKGQYDNQY